MHGSPWMVPMADKQTAKFSSVNMSQPPLRHKEGSGLKTLVLSHYQLAVCYAEQYRVIAPSCPINLKPKFPLFFSCLLA